MESAAKYCTIKRQETGRRKFKMTACILNVYLSLYMRLPRNSNDYAYVFRLRQHDWAIVRLLRPTLKKVSDESTRLANNWK
jgi:hypothetical protein